MTMTLIAMAIYHMIDVSIYFHGLLVTIKSAVHCISYRRAAPKSKGNFISAIISSNLNEIISQKHCRVNLFAEYF